MKIRPGDIDHNAARGLKVSAQNDSSAVVTDFPLNNNVDGEADSPLQVLRDPTLMIFIIICFTFHLSNGTVLPLVMQTLALGGGREGILLSGLCIIIAQIFMVMSASICGKYSGVYGRKGIFLAGLLSVPIRCALITFLVTMKGDNNDGGLFIDILLLSTQILDGVGAGIWGTMYVLVTSDISGGTGRFSMTLGLTTAAMSIGGTVSGYLGQAMAQDIGYRQAFVILGFMALVPASLYFFCMPETLSQEEKANADVPNDTVEDENGESISAPYGQMT
jgi:MFS family permease